jgi:hypothetical protein
MDQFVGKKSKADYMGAMNSTGGGGGEKNQNRKFVNCFGKKQAESNAAHRVSTILASAGLDLA